MTESIENIVEDEITEEAENAEPETRAIDEIVAALPTAKNVKSLTNGDWFTNYGTADLRAHLRFWKNENRCKGYAEELATTDERFADMLREDHIRMLEEEISARDALRSKGGPNA